MFGLSYSEMAVIGLVALIVLGPEQLPAVARTLGRLVRDANRALAEAKAALEREAAPHLEEKPGTPRTPDPPDGPPPRPPEPDTKAGA